MARSSKFGRLLLPNSSARTALTTTATVHRPWSWEIISKRLRVTPRNASGLRSFVVPLGDFRGIVIDHELAGVHMLACLMQRWLVKISNVPTTAVQMLLFRGQPRLGRRGICRRDRNSRLFSVRFGNFEGSAFTVFSPAVSTAIGAEHYRL